MGKKRKPSLASLCTNKKTTTEKNWGKQAKKKVAAFVTLCTICIGIEEEGGGLHSAFASLFHQFSFEKSWIHSKRERIAIFICLVQVTKLFILAEWLVSASDTSS